MLFVLFILSLRLNEIPVELRPNDEAVGAGKHKNGGNQECGSEQQLAKENKKNDAIMCISALHLWCIAQLLLFSLFCFCLAAVIKDIRCIIYVQTKAKLSHSAVSMNKTEANADCIQYLNPDWERLATEPRNLASALCRAKGWKTDATLSALAWRLCIDSFAVFSVFKQWWFVKHLNMLYECVWLCERAHTHIHTNAHTHTLTYKYIKSVYICTNI